MFAHYRLYIINSWHSLYLVFAFVKVCGFWFFMWFHPLNMNTRFIRSNVCKRKCEHEHEHVCAFFCTCSDKTCYSLHWVDSRFFMLAPFWWFLLYLPHFWHSISIYSSACFGPFICVQSAEFFSSTNLILEMSFVNIPKLHKHSNARNIHIHIEMVRDSQLELFQVLEYFFNPQTPTSF